MALGFAAERQVGFGPKTDTLSQNIRRSTVDRKAHLAISRRMDAALGIDGKGPTRSLFFASRIGFVGTLKRIAISPILEPFITPNATKFVRTRLGRAGGEIAALEETSDAPRRGLPGVPAEKMPLAIAESGGRGKHKNASAA